MAVRTEELQLRVLIDGSPARRELAQLDQEYAKLYSSLTGVKKGTEEYIAITTRMGEVRTRQADLRQEIGLTALTAKQLGDELRKLQVAQRHLTPNTEQWTENAARINEVKQRLKELNDTGAHAQRMWNEQAGAVKLVNMSMTQLDMEARRLKATMRDLDPNTAQFVALRSELTRVEQRMATVSSGLGRFGRAWQGVKGQVAGTVAGVGMLFTGGAIMSGVRSWVTGAAKMSDSLADVQRTTNLTAAQVNSLNKDLGKMDTRTARSELLALAADAGKLGISAEKDVLGFVRAGDQIKVALGEDLGDDAIKSIGKLTQTFKVGEQRGLDLEKSLLNTGSAINALGQSSTAAESYLVDYATRMAGVNVQSGISIENTLGYAAAADQLGLKVETTSTAMSQFTIKAFKEPAEYAKIAGMSLKDFNKLLKEDTNEALLRVLEGLNGNNAGMEVMVAKFGDLGQEGARAVSTLAAMSGQTKLIREQQDIANKSFAEGISITTEFQTKNQNFAANLEKIGKALHGLFVNSSVVQGFKDMTGAVVEWMRVPVSEKLEEERIAINGTYAKILLYNEGSKERTKLIKELQTQYPDFLRNIDAEKVSNDQLSKSMKALNEQLINKIVIQRQEEKNAAARENAADSAAKFDEQEQKTYAMLTKLAEKYGIDFRKAVEGATNSLEQATQLRQAIINKQKAQGGSGFFDDSAALSKEILNLAKYKGIYAKRTQIALEGEQEKARLLKQYGLDQVNSLSPKNKPDGGGEDDAPVGDGDAQKKRDTSIQAMEQLREKLLEIRRRIELDALESDARELAEIDDKYAALRAKVVENATHTADDLLTLDGLHEDERNAALQKQMEKRMELQQRLAMEAQQAKQKIEDEQYLGSLDDEDKEITLQMQRMDALVALYEKNGMDISAVVADTEAAIAAIREDYREREEVKAANALKKRINEEVQVYRAVANVIGGVNDFLAATYSKSADNNYQQTAAAKVLGIAQIAISTGIAVAKAISSAAGMGYPANIVAIGTSVAAVLGAVASATSLLRSANVTKPSSPSASASAPPKLQNLPTGEKGGVFHGPSHANGGLAVVDRSTGRVEAEVEGGEPWMVLSNAFRQNNPGLIPRLLHASATGGKLAASGGIFTPAPAFNFARATESLRYMQLARGGLLNAEAVTPAAPPDETSAEMLGLLRVIAAGISSVDEGVRTAPTTMRAEVSLQDINRRQAELRQLQDLNRVGR